MSFRRSIIRFAIVVLLTEIAMYTYISKLFSKPGEEEIDYYNDVETPADSNSLADTAKVDNSHVKTTEDIVEITKNVTAGLLPSNVKPEERKLIYFANRFFGTPILFKELPKQCVTSSNQMDSEKADAIVISITGGNNRWTEQERRNKKVPYDQVWIAMMYESPKTHPYMTGAFNYTMTYRRDSDIVSPYAGQFIIAEPGKTIADVEPAIEKLRLSGKRTKKVLWMVSNCGRLNYRKEYANELAKYITVDIYGSCSHKKLACPRSQERKCWEMAAANYKFYLSFESAHCKDYVTEKFFIPLYFGVLPIVYGGASSDDYKAIAPKHSYIDTRDFSSPKALAEFLHKLDNSTEEYNSYFSWRTRYMVHYNRSFIGQDVLCSKLWNLKNNRHSYTQQELSSWWKNNSTCVEPPFKPK